jgi:hypothetical protein
VKVIAALKAVIVKFSVEFYFQFVDEPKPALKLCDTVEQCEAVSRCTPAMYAMLWACSSCFPTA